MIKLYALSTAAYVPVTSVKPFKKIKIQWAVWGANSDCVVREYLLGGYVWAEYQGAGLAEI